MTPAPPVRWSTLAVHRLGPPQRTYAIRDAGARLAKWTTSSWSALVKPQVRDGGPLVPLKGWCRVDHHPEGDRLPTANKENPPGGSGVAGSFPRFPSGRCRDTPESLPRKFAEDLRCGGA